MINPGPMTKVFLAAGVTDMRKSFDGLYALVLGVLQCDPISGHLFVFANRRRDRLKILFFDGSGLWVCAKRLEKGTFNWPDSASGTPIELTSAELNLLLAGLDIKDLNKRRWMRLKK